MKEILLSILLFIGGVIGLVLIAAYEIIVLALVLIVVVPVELIDHAAKAIEGRISR